MTWDDKVEMVNLLNNGEAKKAADIIIKNKENIDPQAIEMILDGFNISDAEYLMPIVDIIETWQSPSLRSAIRIQAFLDKIHNKLVD